MNEAIPPSSPIPKNTSPPGVSSEIEPKAPESIEDLLQGSKRQQKQVDFEKSQQRKKIHNEEKKQRKKNISIESDFSQLSYSWLYRSFRSVFSFLILTLTVFMSMMFAREKENEVSTTSLLIQTGSAFVSDEFYDGERPVESSPYYISSGTRVTTDAEAEIMLNLEAAGEIRGYEQVDFIFHNEHGTEINLFEGDLWVFAPQTTAVNFGPYTFLIEDGSARFVTQKNSIVVKAWENSLQVLLQDLQTGKELRMALAPMSQALFPISSKNIPEMSTLQQLRFSKLLKEFHVVGITEDERDSKNIRHDEYLTQEIAQQTFEGKAKDRKIWNFLNTALSAFASHRDESRDKQTEEKYALILKSIFSQTFDSTQEIDFSKDTQEDLIEFLWKLQMVEDVGATTSMRQQAEDLILQNIQNVEEQSVFRKLVLSNAVHALQEAFMRQDSQWADLEIQRIQSLWAEVHEEYSHTPSFLSFYREVFFRIFLSYPEQVSERLFVFLDSLNESEIAAARQNEKTTTLLEIIQKNLALSQALTVSQKLTLAKSVFTSADKKIEQIEFSAMDTVYQNTLQQRENVIVRLETCHIFGKCTDREFAEWRKKQKVLACHIDDVCGSEEFASWLKQYVLGETLKAAPIDLHQQPEEIDIKSVGQQMLSSAELDLKTGYAGENNFFVISEAITDNGFRFSGRLSVMHGYLEEVVVLQNPQVEIPGRHTLETIDRIIASVLSTTDSPKETPKEVLPETNILDPVIADLTVRDLQSDLAEYGILVLLEDMNPLSTRNVIVAHALTSTTQIPIQFEYIFQSSQNKQIVKDLILKEYPELVVPETLLQDILQQIEITNEQGKRNTIFLEMTRDILAGAKFIMPEGGFFLEIQGALVAFTGLRDAHGNTLEGTINVDAQTFVTVKHTNAFWSAENVPLQEYDNILRSPPSKNIVETISSEDLDLIDDILNQEAPEIPKAQETPKSLNIPVDPQEGLVELPPN